MQYGRLLLLFLAIAAVAGVACGQSPQKSASVVSPSPKQSPTQVVAGPRQPTWDPNDLAGTAKAICPTCGDNLHVEGRELIFQVPVAKATFSQDPAGCRSLYVPEGVIGVMIRQPSQGRLATPEEIANPQAVASPGVRLLKLSTGETVRQQVGKGEPIAKSGDTGVVCYAELFPASAVIR